MIKLFYPYEYVESVFVIDYDKLYQMGYRGIIFDIDNTLVHHGDDSTREIDELFKVIHQKGFKTLLLSNNSDERINRFNKNINTQFISNADKPKTKNYLKAIEMMNIKKEEVVFVGDQIFTDILGANLSGMANVLVKFIRLSEDVDIGKRRKVENAILNIYLRSKKYTNRLNGITIRE